MLFVNNNLFIIGGASCSGKTTIAKWICEKHGYVHFSADDVIKSLDSNTDKESKNTPEQHMKVVQVYHDLSDHIFNTLNSFGQNRVVAEGMFFLPEIVCENHVLPESYIALAPNDNIVFELLKERDYVKKHYSQNPDIVFHRNHFINKHYQKMCPLLGYEYYKCRSIDDCLLHVSGKIKRAFHLTAPPTEQ